MTTSKPHDPVSYEPVMIALHEARAMAWTLEHLGGAPDNQLNSAILATGDREPKHPEETRDWLYAVVADALHAAHDEIEREYRKLGTNLLQKDLVASEAEIAAFDKRKEGA